MIRVVETRDVPRIAEIYNGYVVGSTITFENEPVSAEGMEWRIAKIQRHYDWLVYEDQGQVVGYAYYGPFRERAAYAATVESTIYLDRASQGREIGRHFIRS